MVDLHVSDEELIKLYNNIKSKVKVDLDRKNETLLNDLLKSQSILSNIQFKGLNPECEAVLHVNHLLKQAIKEEKPVSHFLNYSCFDESVLKTALYSVLIDIRDNEITAEIDPNKLLFKANILLPELINNILTEDIMNIRSQSKDTGVPFEILSMIGGLLIQPGMRLLGETCSKTLLDAWDLTPCPICGRIPSVVIKPETDAWTFSCSFCGIRYKMDIFTCPHCRSEGSENKEFHIVGENLEYEIAECKECKHYFKIINIARLQQIIPNGFEDSSTRVLDEIAIGYGLLRIDE